MCGISGIASLHGLPIEPDAVKRMSDSIAHRGPDDAGYAFFRTGREGGGQGGYWTQYADPDFHHINEQLPAYGGPYCAADLGKNAFTIGLGHRRLAIIDPTPDGHQPMPGQDRRFWITFNGEIYNYPELKSRLSSLGHVFLTRSDTEVLLHLWEEYGTGCLPMLNGMFALAVYDRMENVLTLARDRFGVKPLYFARTGDFLVFGSEIKAVLASGQVPARLRPRAVTEYFTFQNIFGEQTLFEGVELLPPGHFLSARPQEGAAFEPQAFHTGNFEPDYSLRDTPELRDQLVETFASAVRRQLISDVEVGAYLSGGMDSGSIVSVARQEIPRLITFTGGFDLTNVNGIEQGFDERAMAERLSYLFQTEHYAVVLHAGDMPHAMERIAWHMDDPRLGMCHPNWYVSKLASAFVKVCLAGAGGDELFGGYPWRYLRLAQARSAEECDEMALAYWHRLLPAEGLHRLFAPDMRGHAACSGESLREVMRLAPAWDRGLPALENVLRRVLYFETKTFLHGLLVTEDRMSMAHGLETRVPFLDNELFDLAASIPPSLKIRMEAMRADGQPGQLGTAGKLILRRAMERFLPPEYTNQPKQGFSPPDENWFRGPSMDYIKCVLLDRRALERPWMDPKEVVRLLEEHFTGSKNHRLLIWSLLSFEWLQRHFIDA